MGQRSKELHEQLRYYLEFLYRLRPRWWIVAVAVVLAGALSVGLALMLPRYYQSRALITWHEGVNQRRVFSPNEAAAADWNSLQSRLEFLASGATRLRGLMNELDLYRKERRSDPESKVLERMRQAITFDSLGGTSFWIAFEYPDRQRAQAVVKRLVDDFIGENAGNAVTLSAATRDFMDAEVHKARSQIESIDNAIAHFVSDHPEFQTDPATGMMRGRGVEPSPSAQPPIRTIHADTPELRQALAEKGRLQAQLRLQEGGQADAVLAKLRQELATAQRNLVVKRERYTDAHPDVQRARAYVAQLQGQLRGALAGRRTQSASAEKLREQLSEVDRQIEQLTRPKPAPAKVAKAHRASRPSKPVVAGLQLSQPAQLEKRWYRLTRERTVEKAKYDLLQERAIKARMVADLEKRQSLSQFEVIDPPNLPVAPLRPSRMKLAIGGTLLGLLAGLGLAGLLVVFDQRVYNSSDVSRACDLPVLALVPQE